MDFKYKLYHMYILFCILVLSFFPGFFSFSTMLLQNFQHLYPMTYFFYYVLFLHMDILLMNHKYLS